MRLATHNIMHFCDYALVRNRKQASSYESTKYFWDRENSRNMVYTFPMRDRAPSALFDNSIEVDPVPQRRTGGRNNRDSSNSSKGHGRNSNQRGCVILLYYSQSSHPSPLDSTKFRQYRAAKVSHTLNTEGIHWNRRKRASKSPRRTKPILGRKSLRSLELKKEIHWRGSPKTGLFAGVQIGENRCVRREDSRVKFGGKREKSV